MTASTPARLVAEDEELVGLLRQSEDVLLGLTGAEEYSAEHDSEPWQLPAPLAGRVALAALYGVWDALAAVLDELRPDAPPGPRLLGPDGRYEHRPFRLADVDQTEVEVLAAAVAVCNRALADSSAAEIPADEADPAGPERHQLRDLVELLDGMQVDVSLWAPGAEPARPADLLRPLARLIAVLDMQPDGDTTVLAEVLRRHDGAGDIVLTPALEDAYQRVATRLNLLLADDDPLHRYEF